MTIAFVLAGGGNMGAVQVGMLAALQERRVVPDLLVGVSVGALNAAYLGGRGLTTDALDGLAELWRRVRRKDVFPVSPLRQMLALTGRRPSLCSSDPLRHLIAEKQNARSRCPSRATRTIHRLCRNCELTSARRTVRLTRPRS